MSLEGNRWARLRPSNSCLHNPAAGPHVLPRRQQAGAGGGGGSIMFDVASLTRCKNSKRHRPVFLDQRLWTVKSTKLRPSSSPFRDQWRRRWWRGPDQRNACHPISSACVNCQGWVASAVCIYSYICVWVRMKLFTIQWQHALFS